MPGSAGIPQGPGVPAWDPPATFNERLQLAESTIATVQPRSLAPAPTPATQRARTAALVSQFQSGHGFALSGSGGSPTLTNDTTDYSVGTQSVKLVTDADRSITKTAISPTIDFTGRHFRLRFKVDDVDPLKLAAVGVWLSSDNQTTNSLYYQWVPRTYGTTSSPLPPDASGQWLEMVVPWNEFTVIGSPNRAAINHIRLRLQPQSGQTVTARFNLADAVAEPSTGVCSIEFDDAWLSAYTNAFPKMDALGLPGSIWVIRDLSDFATATGGYMGIAELKARQQVGWEIGAHADTVANHNAGFDSLTSTQLITEFEGIKTWLIRNGFRGGDHFVWPRGLYGAGQLDIARRYFATAREDGGPRSDTLAGAAEVYPPADPMRQRCVLVGNTHTTTQISNAITKAAAEKRWLRLVFHQVVNSSADAYTKYLTADFNTVMDAVAASGLRVKTVGEIMATGVTAPA